MVSSACKWRQELSGLHLGRSQYHSLIFIVVLVKQHPIYSKLMMPMQRNELVKMLKPGGAHRVTPLWTCMALLGLSGVEGIKDVPMSNPNKFNTPRTGTVKVVNGMFPHKAGSAASAQVRNKDITSRQTAASVTHPIPCGVAADEPARPLNQCSVRRTAL